MTPRNRNFAVGDRVEHIDGRREGMVTELGVTDDGLPAAVVRWDRGEPEKLALGYLIRMGGR